MPPLQPDASHPTMVLKRGVWFPPAQIALKGEFDGKSFRLLTSGISKELVLPQGESAWMSSPFKWLLMEVRPRTEIFELYDWLLELGSLCSLKLGSMYLAPTPAGPHVHSGATGHNQAAQPDTTDWLGLRLTDGACRIQPLELNSDTILQVLSKAESLSETARGYVRSAAFLITEAKERLFRGEDSGAITAAVSAVEAMYLRPNAQGYFSETEPRLLASIGAGGGKEARFKRAFCRSTSSLEALHNDLMPYTVRSGHLHSGKVSLFRGDPTQRPDGDAVVSFVLACQDAILSLVAQLQ